jgi:hypothetical protein
VHRQADVADVIVAIRASGTVIEELRILEPDLEEAFLQIMGRP